MFRRVNFRRGRFPCVDFNFIIIIITRQDTRQLRRIRVNSDGCCRLRYKLASGVPVLAHRRSRRDSATYRISEAE